MFIRALPPASREALATLAIRERRDARDQAAMLIIAELHRRGVVSEDGTEATAADAVAS